MSKKKIKESVPELEFKAPDLLEVLNEIEKDNAPENSEFLEEVIKSLPVIVNDIIVDGIVFQAFNKNTFVNFINVSVIQFIEYSQPSENVYKCHYEFHLNSGRTISSPQFNTKESLDLWLNEIKKR